MNKSVAGKIYVAHMVQHLQEHIEEIITTGNIPGDDINKKISHLLTQKAHLHSIVQWMGDRWFEEYEENTQQKLDIILKKLYAIKDLPIYQALEDTNIE